MMRSPPRHQIGCSLTHGYPWEGVLQVFGGLVQASAYKQMFPFLPTAEVHVQSVANTLPGTSG